MPPPAILLDTCFFITCLSPSQPHHKTADAYLKYFLKQNTPLILSTLVAGEFAVKQPINDLPLAHLNILPFNFIHAIKAAELRKILNPPGSKDSRSVIINDINILGQVAQERIPFILSEDEKTLSRFAVRLRAAKQIETKVVLLRDGFNPEQFAADNFLSLASL
jgi:hypothetical protein